MDDKQNGNDSNNLVSTLVRVVELLPIALTILVVYNRTATEYPQTQALILCVFLLVFVVVRGIGLFKTIQGTKSDKNEGNEQDKIPEHAMVPEQDKIPQQGKAGDKIQGKEKNPTNYSFFGIAEKIGEIVLLVVVTFIAIDGIGKSAPNVPQEVSDAQLNIPKLVCEGDETTVRFRLVLTNFAELSGNSSFVEDRVDDTLDNFALANSGSGLVVCRTEQTVLTKHDAQGLGTRIQQSRGGNNKNTTTIVVWGRIDTLYEVNWDVINAPGVNPTQLPSDAAAANNFAFQLQEPNRISFITRFLVSQILIYDALNTDTKTDYNQFCAKLRHSRSALDDAVHFAALMGISAKNPTEVTQAYYRLGTLYDYDTQDFDDDGKIISQKKNDLHNAVKYYDLALNLTSDFAPALFRKGLAEMTLSQDDSLTPDNATTIRKAAEDSLAKLTYTPGYEELVLPNLASLSSDNQKEAEGYLDKLNAINISESFQIWHEFCTAYSWPGDCGLNSFQQTFKLQPEAIQPILDATATAHAEATTNADVTANTEAMANAEVTEAAQSTQETPVAGELVISDDAIMPCPES